MDVFDAIRGRRSHRAFVQKPVEPEKVELILEAAQWAPSPANSQPWEFVVITGKAPRARIASMSEDAGRKGSIEIHGYSYVRPTPFSSDNNNNDEARSRTSKYSLDFLDNVPVMIAVVGSPETALHQATVGRSKEGYKYACAAAIQNMLLAAQAQGLGSLWFTYFDLDALSQFLNVPADKHLIAVICVGYPDSIPPSPGRDSLQQKVRRMD